MSNNKGLFFVNQLLDALEKAGKKKVNLDLAPRAVLIAIAKHAYKSGNAYCLTSQIENASGVAASNQNKIFKILENRKFLTIKRKFFITKEGKKMTKNTYKIHLDVILNLSINTLTGEIEIENQSIINEPSVLSTSGSIFEPSVLSTTLKPNKLKQHQKQKHLDIVQASLDAPDVSNILSMPVDYYFEEFWAAYPRKEKKVEAKKVWIKDKLDKMAAQIIDDVRLRQVRHLPWLEGRSFIPLPTTYLNGERWNDDLITNENKDSSHARTQNTTAGNITGYAQQLVRAAGNLNDRYVRAVQNNLGRKVDEEF